MNRVVYALCLLLMLAAVAGCGGDEGGNTSDAAYDRTSGGQEAASTNQSEKPVPKKPARAGLFGADAETLDNGLFGDDGFTLYRFDRDRGANSTCYGACAKRWPPYLTEGRPNGADVVSHQVGTTKRRDGTTQVTYFGHPLYTFVGDKTTGEISGHGIKDFGGVWYALHATGQDAELQR